MKSIHLLIAVVLFIGTTYSQTVFPKKMPSDFKIELNAIGAMSSGNQLIVLQKGECKHVSDGWDEPEENYTYTFTLDKKGQKQLATLYLALKNLNAFTLKMDGPLEESYPGEGITYTINGTKYQLGNYAGAGIVEADQNAYNQSISLIIDFAKKYRK